MAFHYQTVRETERVNQIIEAYLRPFLNQGDDSWVDLLLMAYPAYNTSVTSATRMTLFYPNYGWHPESQNPLSTEVMNPASHSYAHWIAGTLNRGKEALSAARERMIKYANVRKRPPQHMRLATQSYSQPPSSNSRGLP